MKKALVISVMILCVCGLLCSCEKEQQTTDTFPVPENTSSITIKKDSAPLKLYYSETRLCGIPTKIPQLSSSEIDSLLNSIISQRLSDFASGLSSAVKNIDCDITYNDHGIISLVFTAHEKSASTKHCLPITLNVATGNDIPLSSLFDPKDTTWQELMKFYADEEIRLRRLDTHSAISFKNNKPFYLTASKLVIVYEMYELSYSSQGSVCIEVPLSAFDKYLDPSVLVR